LSFSYHCLSCITNSVINTINLQTEQSEQIIRDVLKYLSKTDYKKSAPEIAGGVWEIVRKHTGGSDPYREIKNYYNNELLKIYDEISKTINSSKNKFNTALKIAIAGNLIDFAAQYSFSMKTVKRSIIESKNMRLKIDHSKKLYKCLKQAGSLLYLGDNCGEIVLDKLFIELIKKKFPGLHVFYGVRGKPVLNDVTEKDAEMVGMEKTATVIENGDGSVGTVLTRVSRQFREVFTRADVIIAKGQGNYESLASADRENIFFLLMAKCRLVAKAIGVDDMAILCIKNTPRR